MIIDSILESGCKKKEPWNVIINPKEKVAAIKETALWHFQNCPLYHLFNKNKGFYPFKEINSQADFAKIPYITTASFKRFGMHAKDFLTVPDSKIKAWSFSRGSTMDTSLIGREDVNLTRMLQGFEIVFKQILKLPDIRWALLCIPPIPQDLYDKPYPKKVPHFNYFFEQFLKSWGENLLLKDYGIKIVRPNARYEIQKYGVDLDSIESLFNNTLTEQVPGVIFGFVPGIFLGLKAYYEKHRSVPKIHKNSMVISFGGWSAPDRRKIEPENFREKVSSFLKLDPKNIRDIYCFTETDPIFAECEFHNKHIPPWVDVIVRNVETLEPVADGQKGLTNVINPMAYSYAGVSLLQDDVVKIETMDSCPCGREGKIIKVYGPAN